MNKFNILIRNKKNPDTSIPMISPMFRKYESSSLAHFTEIPSKIDIKNTTVEWSIEK